MSQTEPQDAAAAQMEQFSEPVRTWFAATFGSPTPAQKLAWETISQAGNALVIAPTGSGKTLAAFLWAIDVLARRQPVAEAARKTKVVYISPLKALGVDVRKNLEVPLACIRDEYERSGLQQAAIAVGVRSGDTTAQERRRLRVRPPDILITTPESLYLMLTSGAAETLDGVETVIVDEIHSLAGTKRGAHLALSLERLDNLLSQRAQRIGLSATARPVEEIGRFLGGSAPVRIIQPPSDKKLVTIVDVPMRDMTNPEPENLRLGIGVAEPEGILSDHRVGSTWPAIEDSIYRRVMNARSTIIFANSRRLAERITGALNDIHQKACPDQPEIARSHHGSVSKEQRLQVETDLKAGTLRCVVATASLELGIDMGAVDQVIQVDAPPSVASGLQRIGRAGHQVGQVSTAVFYPVHRSRLLEVATVAGGIHERAIEATRVVQNPLDILAQQTVAAVSRGSLQVDDWFSTVRRAAPFRHLSRQSFEAVLDLLAGRYPSTAFSELRPRLVWDRQGNTLTARPGAGRLAIMNGGTIPDRGLYRVEALDSSDDGSQAPRRPSPRIGELDEEMVHESRVGEVFVLGTSSWRIREITADRVRVIPAPGERGRLPFWRGDSAHRPAELGWAIGALTRELDRAVRLGDTTDAAAALRANGMDDRAIANTFAYLAEQREAAGAVPTDAVLVVERSKDEVGDWQITLESPLGMAVHSPWSLAIAARLRERYGTDGQISASNDGIVLRFPDAEGEPPGADLFFFDPSEIVETVQREVTGSALFAARFRECSARALLLGGGPPGKRSPLWQQRQRATRLLEVAAKYQDFPMVVEAARECLNDVYDLPALVEVCSRLSDGRMRIHQITTERPSPFARSLLFGYVGEFLYQGDLPLGERRLAALSADPDLIAGLLGSVSVADLLEPGVAEEVEAELQRTVSDRRLRGAEGVIDLLRQLGPLTLLELGDRLEEGPVDRWVAELTQAGRVFTTSLAGTAYVAQVEDAGLLVALGADIDPGIALSYPAGPDPAEDLLSRYARTHGPFATDAAAGRYGIQAGVVEAVLERLAERAALSRIDSEGGAEWVDSRVLETMRRRSAARLRGAIQPVPPARYAQFLLNWQYCGQQLADSEGILAVVEQLCGAPLVASTVETLILPQRVADYEPALLEGLVVSGEVIWVGEGRVGDAEGRISLHLRDSLRLTLPDVSERAEWSEMQQWILHRLQQTGARFGTDLQAEARDAFPEVRSADFVESLWGLVWGGRITSDSMTALRSAVSGRAPAQKTRPPRPRGRSFRRGSFAPLRPAAAADPRLAGRWSLVSADAATPAERDAASLSLLLDRYGVLTRGSVMAEEFQGGFAAAYDLLSGFESAGYCRRGNFIEGLGGAQFAPAAVIDRLREDPEPGVIVVSATDPANAYGAALPWPEVADPNGARPRRNPGALIAIEAGLPVFYLERGGKTALSFAAAPDREIAEAIFQACRTARLDDFLLELIDGQRVGQSPWHDALLEAGFFLTPRGLRYQRPTL